MKGKRSTVLCINTGEIFRSVTAAADAAGVDKSGMSRHLSGKQATVNGKIYMVIEPDLTPRQIEDAKRAKLEELKRKRIQDLNEILIF